MQKIFAIIIALVLLFSSPVHTFANKGIMDELLDLSYGPEEYNLTLASLDYKYFISSETTAYYNRVSQTNELLQSAILEQHRSGKLGYYTISGVISAQKKFVYHLNELFDGIALKEMGYDYGELDDYILDNYELSRVYYRKVRTLIKNAE